MAGAVNSQTSKIVAASATVTGQKVEVVSLLVLDVAWLKHCSRKCQGADLDRRHKGC
jgi:hypothetical protein